ncbi:MAG TPA: glycosyltransferase, partial [Ferruginibacter sp.]|nr:glycosyltransferase [Ferruginibacter sp.]
MKVLFALDTLANAGTEKSTLDIISHFTADVEVVVCCFFPGDDLKEAYEKAGIRLRYEPIRGRFPLLTGIRKLKQILVEEKPDVVVSSILRANLMARIACKQTGIPLVGTFVSDSYSALRKSSFSLKRRLGFYYYYR